MANNPYKPSDGGSAISSNNPYGASAGVKKIAPPKVTTPTTKAVAAPKPAELPPILGLGQGILKGFLTPWAASIGALDSVLQGVKQQKSQGSWLAAGAKNVAALWGSKDLFGEGGWDKIKTGETVVKDLGMEEQMLTIPAQALQNLPILGGIGRSLTANGRPDAQVPVGTNTFWSGFALDVAVDPLNFSTKGLVQGAKGVAKAGQAVTKAAKLAGAGEISAAVAAKKAGQAVEITNKFTKADGSGLSGQLRTPQRLESLKKTVTQTGGKAAERVAKADAALDKFTYKTFRVDSPRGLGEAAKDIIASAMDAGAKSIASTAVSARTINFLEKYAKRDITKFGRKLVTNVVKDAETGGYNVLSGNKVLLGTADNKFEAEKLAGLIKKGLAPAQALTPATVIQGAQRVAKTSDANEESLVVPSKEGGQVQLEKYVPHASEDGTFAVFDGENVAVFKTEQDANDWVSVYTSPLKDTAELAEPVLSGSAGKWQVTVGTEVTRFTNKKQAAAYAEAIRTGQVQGTRRVTSGGTPIIDTAPIEVSVKEALAAPTAEGASALRSVLDGIDQVAKKTSGWRGEVSLDVANTIKRVIGTQQAALDKALIKMQPEIFRDLKAFIDSEINFKDLVELLNKKTTPERGQMLAILNGVPVYTSKGTLKLGEAIKQANGRFLNMTKAIEGVAGSTLERQVISFIDTQLVKRGMGLKSGKIKPAYDAEGKYQALVNAVGEKIADRIKATGYLDTPNDKTRAKYEAVLNDLSVQNSEVSYAGYDDLIKGLERGDSVSDSALEEIFKLLDPDGKIISSVEQAAAEPASAFLRRAFTREGGVASIREAEKRLAMMRDPQMLMKHSNLSYDADIAAIIKILDSDNKQAIADLTVKQSRQASAESFADYPREIRDDAADSIGRAFFGDPKKGGEGGLLALKQSIMDNVGAEIRLTTLDDYAAMTGEAYADGSRAMLTRQVQQSGEAKVISSLVSKDSSRLQRAAKMAKLNNTKFIPKTGPERLNTLIQKLSAANDLATAQGWRFVRTKNRNDKAFQDAYLAEIAAAKKSKTTPNFSALNTKHTVYLPMGDILATLKPTSEAALVKAFFPSSKNVKRDSMDWIALGDGARRVLEMDAAGEPFDLEEIARRIASRGADREALTPARKAEVDAIARELADALTTPEVVGQLKGIHLDAAASIIKDFANKNETFAANLFDTMDEAFAAMHLNNDLSEVARVEAVRTFFRKFVIASDIMRIEGGPIAEAMFRATAMTFVDGGKILPKGQMAEKLTGKAAEFWNILREEEYQLFREAITKMYRFEGKPAAPVGREGMKTPKPEAQMKALKALDEAENAYKVHMDELQTLEPQAMDDLATIKAWEAKKVKLQAKLDKARATAWTNWVPTRHWTPEGWVASEVFNAEKAAREAQAAHQTYVAGRKGLENRAAYLADSEPVIPPHRKMSASEKAKFLAKFNKEMTEAQVDNARSIVDDVSRNVADEVEAGRLDIEELAPNEQMMRAAQEAHVRGIKEATEIKVRRVSADYKVALPKNDREFNELFRPGLDPNTPVFRADRRAARIRRAAEQWSGPTGRKDTVQLLKHAENGTVAESSNFAEALDKMSRKYAKRPPEEMMQAWTILRDGKAIPEDASGFLKAIITDMEMFTNQILRGHSRSVLSQNGINGSVLSDMFERFGLKADYGFTPPTEFKGKTPDELTDSMFAHLPFGGVPEKLKGTQAAIEWEQRAERFTESGMTPLLAFTRTMEAIQMVKMEKGIAENAAAQFGWKTHFKTIEQAKEAGWVQIEAVGKQNIARFLPGPEQGGLFHPAIADQLGSVFREYNNMYEGNQLNSFLRSAMKVMGVIKFTQTTLMPRHHVTNAFGDFTTAFIAGLRNPRDLIDGFSLSAVFTSKNFEADWGKFGKDLEAKVYRMAGALSDQPGVKMSTVGVTPDTLTFNFYKNGKPVAQNFNVEAFADDLAARGGLVPGFVQADLQGFTGDLALQGSTAAQKAAFKEMFTKFIARPGRATMKGFSDFTAAYSNFIRGAHALKVARSRTWNSYEEMMNAVMDTLNLYHPTVQSLASTERKWGRLLFTYYTWIRVAHSALIDMAVNHTASMLAVPKGMYNYSVMQGFNPANPAEPFESKNALPDYVSYSVYGPNAMSAQGARSYRPPFLPLDILDFWQIYMDPSKPQDENLLNAAGQIGRTFGKSTNILGAPIIAGLFGVDPSTGAPLNVKNSEAAVDEFLSNFGFMSALTGMGLYTPYKYRNPNTTNPLTDEDRKRLLENSFTGMRSVDIQRPVNLAKAESQYRSRVKSYNERTFKDNVKKAQEFYDQKIGEGFSTDEILQMLKDMGFN